MVPERIVLGTSATCRPCTLRPSRSQRFHRVSCLAVLVGITAVLSGCTQEPKRQAAPSPTGSSSRGASVGGPLRMAAWSVGGNVPLSSLTPQAHLALFGDRWLVLRQGQGSSHAVRAVQLSVESVSDFASRLEAAHLEYLPSPLDALRKQVVGLPTDVVQVCLPDRQVRLVAYGLSSLGKPGLPQELLPSGARTLAAVLDQLEALAVKAPTAPEDVLHRLPLDSERPIC